MRYDPTPTTETELADDFPMLDVLVNRIDIVRGCVLVRPIWFKNFLLGSLEWGLEIADLLEDSALCEEKAE